jgi:hypothetical protein
MRIGRGVREERRRHGIDQARLALIANVAVRSIADGPPGSAQTNPRGAGRAISLSLPIPEEPFTPGAMQAALEHDRPAQIEAMVSRYEISIPPTITARRVFS